VIFLVLVKLFGPELLILGKFRHTLTDTLFHRFFKDDSFLRTLIERPLSWRILLSEVYGLSKWPGLALCGLVLSCLSESLAVSYLLSCLKLSQLHQSLHNFHVLLLFESRSTSLWLILGPTSRSLDLQPGGSFGCCAHLSGLQTS